MENVYIMDEKVFQLEIQLSLGAGIEDINPPGSSWQIHRELIHGLAILDVS